MVKPPISIDGAHVLEWAWSQQPFGEVRCGDGSTTVQIFGLALCRYPNDAQVYRFSCDGHWECQQDQMYGSLEEARTNLPAQYRNVPVLWQKSEEVEP